MRALLAAGADPNINTESGLTLLHLAANAQTVKLALKAWLDINARAKNGRTSLHVANRWGHADTILALHEAGVRTDMHDNDGPTPLLIYNSEQQNKAYLCLATAALITVSGSASGNFIACAIAPGYKGDGDPDRTRTCYREIRNLALYPDELRGRKRQFFDIKKITAFTLSVQNRKGILFIFRATALCPFFSQNVMDAGLPALATPNQVMAGQLFT